MSLFLLCLESPLTPNPSPNLSPTGGEALKPPFPLFSSRRFANETLRERREGGRRVRLFRFDVNNNTFQTDSKGGGTSTPF
jgi:hypothetical protein